MVQISNRNDEALTILSFGAGQDSTAIFFKLIYDAAFRAQYAPGKLLVIMADTQDEHPDTYAHVEVIKRIAGEHGIEFVHLTSDMGYHTTGWDNGLRGQFRRNN